MRAALLALLAYATFASAAQRSAPGYSLTLVVEGVRNTRGVIGVLVFDSPNGWPEDVQSAFRSMAVPAQAPVTELTIPDLPPGVYAVVVLHDEKLKMKLDRDWLGRPKEQWGMSNNPHAFLSAPSFDNARFGLHENERMYIWLR